MILTEAKNAIVHWLNGNLEAACMDEGYSVEKAEIVNGRIEVHLAPTDGESMVYATLELKKVEFERHKGMTKRIANDQGIWD